jgi:putative PIN family toxin of toxin-antitoxin system
VKSTKAVIDTNVFVSGIFFSGPPCRILKAWNDELIQVALSEEVIVEYRRVVNLLSAKLKNVNFDSVFEPLLMKTELVGPCYLKEPVCQDPDDDKFIACAIASRCQYIISGDKHLLDVGKYNKINIVTPRYFVDNLL